MIVEELEGRHVFVIHGFLSADECAEQVRRAEAIGFDEAPITTLGGFEVVKEVRNNTRVMIDDPAYAAALWDRALAAFATPIRSQGLRWEAVGLNERFRYYRYDVGQRFAPHFDGAFSPRDGETSRLTFMIYLNDDFDGGETRFFEAFGRLRLAVRPEVGKALVFVHAQLHEGAAIVRGRKYVLRTDVMFRATG
jgi:predicted 2-oxoglutarate/Fe(II)-dependent dioxygenase YbiX